VAVLGLLGVIAAEITLSTRQESQTFDEAARQFDRPGHARQGPGLGGFFRRN